MTRRFPIIAAAVALAATLASGCSTFTRNDSAAVVGGRELSIDDYENMVQDLGGEPDAFGEFGGATGRQILTAWVSVRALYDALSDNGVVVSDDARAAAASQMQQSEPDWDAWAQSTRDFQVDYVSALNAIAQAPELVPDSQLEAAYNSGKDVSRVLCMRVMAFESVTEASAAADQLEAGADFAALADEHPLDPSAPANGGVFADPESGAECLSMENQQIAELAAAIGQTEVGKVAGPLTFGEATYLFLERPFVEVAGEVRALLGSGIASVVARGYVSSVDATIDSRYGMWDKDAGQVVPAR